MKIKFCIRLPAMLRTRPQCRHVATAGRVVLQMGHCAFPLVLCIFLLLAGCVGLRPTPPSQRVSILPVALTGGVQVAAQYARSTAPRTGCNTAEIYLENHGTNAIRFESASLNGEELPVVKAKAASSLDSVILDGEVMPLVDTGLPPDREVVWWQFYPSPELKPGGTIVCQINFRNIPTAQRRLELSWIASDASTENSPGGSSTVASGAKAEATAAKTGRQSKIENIVVPRFRQPETLITAITYPVDYSKVYIQYQSKHVPPAKLWLNNHEVVGFTVLPSSEPDTPDMLMVPCDAGPDSRFPIKTGMPLHVKLQFPNGSVRQALVRAMSGIALDAWFKQRPSDKELKVMGLDLNPLISLMPFDVACQDSKKSDKGGCAPAVTASRQKTYDEKKDQLAGLAACTAMYPELWNIYGQIADAFYVKPYRLNWGHNSRRFIEEEEECMDKAQVVSRPRPLLWIPERFKRNRYLEPEEMRVMGWMLLARGGKGIRYHFWRNEGQDPFAGCPLLLPAMKALNHEVREHVTCLSPLTLVSERTIKQSDFGVKVYTAWSGNQGILVMVRNLDYQTDKKADDEGRSPRFHAAPKTDVTIPVVLPAWFRFDGANDFLTDQSVPVVNVKRGVDLKLKKLDAFRLIWLENK